MMRQLERLVAGSILLTGFLNYAPGEVFACSMAPGHMLNIPHDRQETVPPNFVVRYWHSYGRERDYKIVNSNGENIPVEVTTVEVPGSLLPKNLIPLYDSERFFTTIAPKEDMAPGNYSFYIGGNRKLFRVAGKADTEAPKRIGNFRPDFLTESTYVSYDSECQPIYERRPFLTVEVPAEHVAAGEVFEAAVYPASTRYDEPDNKSVIHGIPAPEESTGSFTLKIPTWWLTRSIPRARAEEGWYIELTAIDQAGNRSAHDVAIFNAPEMWNN